MTKETKDQTTEEITESRNTESDSSVESGNGHESNTDEPVDNETEETDNPNAEAAKYRKRLRETETERDNLAAKVEAYQRAEVEQYAEHLAKPSAIWAAGIEIKDLLDDDGNIDQTKTRDTINKVAADLGLAPKARTPKPHPAQAGKNGIPGAGPDDRMAALIAGKRH